MTTRACRRKLMATLKSATKNCTESVKKKHATENEKKFVPLCNLQYIPRGNCVSQRCSNLFQLAGYTILASHNVDKNSKFTTEYSRALGSYAHGRTCNEERHWSSKMKITALHRETKNTGTPVSYIGKTKKTGISAQHIVAAAMLRRPELTKK